MCPLCHHWPCHCFQACHRVFQDGCCISRNHTDIPGGERREEDTEGHMDIVGKLTLSDPLLEVTTLSVSLATVLCICPHCTGN